MTRRGRKPTLRYGDPLPANQQTIINSLSTGISLLRPPQPIRSGLITPSSGQANTVLGRRLVGGDNEKLVVAEFARFRLSKDQPQAGDEAIANGVFPTEEEDSDNEDFRPTKRYSYSREVKLAAIDYFQTTWKLNSKTNLYERLSIRYAARRLKIDRQMLKQWVATKESIMRQKRGSFRSRRSVVKVQEPEMERRLVVEFDIAREHGRKVDFKWVIRHAQKIYSEMYPQRIIRSPTDVKNRYLGFKFSPGWYRGWKARNNLTLRTGTKRAQKAPEELLPTIQKWLQYNRRMMVVREGSEVGLAPTLINDIPVPTVGRFKLSEIANMDQSPLCFEFLKGKTLNRKGARTVRLKGVRSGWDKRMCTLQICIFADGVPRIKPLLMFKGSGKMNRNLREEYTQYDTRVKVVFNSKAYANTSNLIEWVKSQYSSASAYLPRDQEPRLLSLDAFAPHKNKGKKIPEKESEKAREKRLREEELQKELRQEFIKLRCTLSLIPGGCTGYLQVLDLLANKLIKLRIEDSEQQWIEDNWELYKAGKFSVRDRRILITKWVGEAWEWFHYTHRDAIIHTFQSVGLSLNPDGSQDHLLHIRDLPGLVVGEWETAPIEANGTAKNPTIIADIVEVEDAIYIEPERWLHREGESQEQLERDDDENMVTTDSNDDSEDDSEDKWDYSSGSDFDEEADGDEDTRDENM